MAITKKKVAKKTTTKPAAKKTTVKKTVTKPAAKKTAVKKTAAKTVVKKTAVNKATAKPAAKKTTVKKVVAKPANELSVTGNKKIGTLMKEFNKKFPYLNIWIGYSYARKSVANGEKMPGIDRSKTLASVRRADSGGDISITGNKKIQSLEKDFDTVFGLYCQVCYQKDDHRYYTSGSTDEMTLSKLNEYCEKNGYKKGAWK